jgi:uncharacterized protein
MDDTDGRKPDESGATTEWPSVSESRTKMRAPFEVKTLAPAGDELGGWDFEGHFSVFDNEDLEGDIVRRGAFADSLKAHLPKVCDHHGITVGQAVKAFEDETGLFVKGRIYPTAAGTDLAKLMTPIETSHGRHAPVEQGSIGYSILGSKKRQGKGLELTRLFAWEVSPVTFGANPVTRVALKSLDDVHQLPTGELLAYAGEVARLAIDGADGVKALHRRRVAEDRDLTDEQWQAADELLLTAAEATLDLLSVKARAGRKATSAQMRHTEAIISGMVELVHGRNGGAEPAPEPDEPPPSPPRPIPDDDETNEDESAEAKAEAGDERAGSRSKDLRGREIELDILLADLGVSVESNTEA